MTPLDRALVLAIRWWWRRRMREATRHPVPGTHQVWSVDRRGASQLYVMDAPTFLRGTAP